MGYERIQHGCFRARSPHQSSVPGPSPSRRLRRIIQLKIRLYECGYSYCDDKYDNYGLYLKDGEVSEVRFLDPESGLRSHDSWLREGGAQQIINWYNNPEYLMFFGETNKEVNTHLFIRTKCQKHILDIRDHYAKNKDHAITQYIDRVLLQPLTLYYAPEEQV